MNLHQGHLPNLQESSSVTETSRILPADCPESTEIIHQDEDGSPTPGKDTQQRQVDGFQREDFITKNIQYLQQLFVDKKRELQKERFAEKQ